MAIDPQATLAGALDAAVAKAERGVIRGVDLTRAQREALQRNDMLLAVLRGWYLLTKPGLARGATA